jgi:hypothetical protein
MGAGSSAHAAAVGLGAATVALTVGLPYTGCPVTGATLLALGKTLFLWEAALAS